jgi:hypothetical protein
MVTAKPLPIARLYLPFRRQRARPFPSAVRINFQNYLQSYSFFPFFIIYYFLISGRRPEPFVASILASTAAADEITASSLPSSNCRRAGPLSNAISITGSVLRGALATLKDLLARYVLQPLFLGSICNLTFFDFTARVLKRHGVARRLMEPCFTQMLLSFTAFGR